MRVHETELPGDLLGCVDVDRRIIWLDSRLTEAERRCTLAHELGHLERGLPCDQGQSNATDATERAIDEWAARLLIPACALAHAVQWSCNVDEIAEELWVDSGMVRARFRSLTDDEQDMVLQTRQPARRVDGGAHPSLVPSQRTSIEP